MIVNDENLKLHSIDNGFCRIYYKYNGVHLYCLQEEGSCTFEFYKCSRDGEPEYPFRYGHHKLPIPQGDTTIEKNARDYLMSLQ